MYDVILLIIAAIPLLVFILSSQFLRGKKSQPKEDTKEFNKQETVNDGSNVKENRQGKEGFGPHGNKNNNHRDDGDGSDVNNNHVGNVVSSVGGTLYSEETQRKENEGREQVKREEIKEESKNPKRLEEDETQREKDKKNIKWQSMKVDGRFVGGKREKNSVENKRTFSLSEENFKLSHDIRQIAKCRNSASEMKEVEGLTGSKDIKEGEVTNRDIANSANSITAYTTTLSLTHKNLVLLPFSLRHCTHLVHVDLSHNNLSSLPNYFINNMKNLETLNISHNRFFELPSTFNFPKLKSLDLSYNKFEFLPPCIHLHMSGSLKELKIDHNFLMIIPEEINKMKELELFDISHNSVMKLPENITMHGFGTKLKKFKIFNNKFLNQTGKILVKLFELNPALERQMTLDELEEMESTSDSSSQSSSDEQSLGKVSPTHSMATEPISDQKDMQKPQDSSPAPKNKNFQQRICALNELVESERKYTRYLTIMYKQYYLPIFSLSSKNSPPLSDNDKDEIHPVLDFSSLPIPNKEQALKYIFPPDLVSIISFNRKLLCELEKCLPNGASAETLNQAMLGQIFIDYAPFLKLYTNYMSSYELANNIFTELAGTNPKIQEFFDEAKMKIPEADCLGFADMIIMPVQRVPRYTLLLSTLLSFTPPEHPDYVQLKEAIGKVKNIADYINIKISESSNRMKVKDIQYNLGVKGLIAPHRQYLRDCTFIQTDEQIEFHVYLFNDMILLNKYTSMLSKINQILKRNNDKIRIYSLIDAELCKPDGERTPKRQRSKSLKDIFGGTPRSPTGDDLADRCLSIRVWSSPHSYGMDASRITAENGQLKEIKLNLLAPNASIKQIWEKDLAQAIELSNKKPSTKNPTNGQQ